MTEPIISFVLDGFPRTGSTTLTRILNTHPDIECCMEPFHPERFGGEFNRLALEHGSTTVPLGFIQIRWTGLKHVWEPGTGWPFVGRHELNNDLIRHAGTIVTLRRRNLLRQYVSSFISKRLGFWVGTSDEFYARLDSAYLPPITVAEAQASLAEATDAMRKRDELLRGLSAKQLVIFYEDIFEASEGGPDRQADFCNWLFVQLGYQPVETGLLIAKCQKYFDPTKYKWANNEVYARIPGMQLVEKQLGNEINGRIFT